MLPGNWRSLKNQTKPLKTHQLNTCGPSNRPRNRKTKLTSYVTKADSTRSHSKPRNTESMLTHQWCFTAPSFKIYSTWLHLCALGSWDLSRRCWIATCWVLIPAGLSFNYMSRAQFDSGLGTVLSWWR